MLLRLIANAVLFEIGWTACVLAGRLGYPLLAVAAVGSLLALHLLWTTPRACRMREIGTIASIATMGTLVDSANLASGILTYDEATGVTPVFVGWIAAFWVNFAMLPNASLRWLKNRLALAAVLGGVLAPPSYIAGAKLGAIGMHENLGLAWGVLGVQWAILTPVFMLIARRLVPLTREHSRSPLRPTSGEVGASASESGQRASSPDGTATGGTQES